MVFQILLLNTSALFRKGAQMTLRNALQESVLILSFAVLGAHPKCVDRCRRKGALQNTFEYRYAQVFFGLCWWICQCGLSGCTFSKAPPVLQETGAKHPPEGHFGESLEHPFGRGHFKQTFGWYSKVIFQLPFTEEYSSLRSDTGILFDKW